MPVSPSAAENAFSLAALWHALGWPLLRLLMGMAAGLLIANVLEALRWTRHLARLAAPLARLAHLRSGRSRIFPGFCFSCGGQRPFVRQP